jgi:hypothetical protein
MSRGILKVALTGVSAAPRLPISPRRALDEPPALPRPTLWHFKRAREQQGKPRARPRPRPFEPPDRVHGP